MIGDKDESPCLLPIRRPVGYVSSLMVLVATACLLFATRPSLTRDQFLDRIEHIEDSTQTQVQRLLGPPDDVWTYRDPPPFGNLARAHPIWAYGTRGHLSFPTLGTVTFGRDGTARTHVGGWYPPASGVWRDTELANEMRRIYSILHPRGEFNSDVPGSLEILRLANHLIGLGRKRALVAVAEYDLVSHRPDFLLDDYQALERTLRCIVDWGAAGGPPDRSNPLLGVIDDVPLQLWVRRMGNAVDFVPNLVRNAWDGNARFRSSPLVPPNDPLSLDNPGRAAAFASLKAGERDNVFLADLEGQLVDLVRTAYRPPEGLSPTRTLDMARDFVREHPIRWDSWRQAYIGLDGHFLPVPRSPSHPLVTLDLPAEPGQYNRVSLERSRPGVLMVSVANSSSGHSKYEAGIWDAATGDQLLAIEMPGSKIRVVGAHLKWLSLDSLDTSELSCSSIEFQVEPHDRFLLRWTVDGKRFSRVANLPKEPAGLERIDSSRRGGGP